MRSILTLIKILFNESLLDFWTVEEQGHRHYEEDADSRELYYAPAREFLLPLFFSAGLLVGMAVGH